MDSITEQFYKVRFIPYLRKLILEQFINFLPSVLPQLDFHPCPASNQLLLMELDDDVLITILSFLKLRDWIALHGTNWRMRSLVNRYMFPANIIEMSDKFYKRYPREHYKELHQDMEENVRSLDLTTNKPHRILSNFRNLKHLFLPHKEEGLSVINLIPDGLVNLEIALLSTKQPLESLFTRLSRTLTTLEISGEYFTKELALLTNLKQLRMAGYSSITTDLSGCLRNNKDSLELLEMRFFHPDDFTDHDIYFSSDDDSDYEDDGTGIPFAMSPLTNLRSLRLDNLSHVVNLHPDDFPALREIFMSFYNCTSVEVIGEMISDVARFKNLRVLHIRGARVLEVAKNLGKLKDSTNQLYAIEEGIFYSSI